MKKFIPFFLLILLGIGCQKSNNSKKFIDNEDNLEYEMFIANLYENNLNREQICENETLRALNDIENDDLTYFLFAGLGTDGRYWEEMTQILNLNNIKTDVVLVSCIRSADEVEEWENCYPKLMNSEISERYGDTFIDSIYKISEKRYIHSKKDEVFSFGDKEPSLGERETFINTNDSDSLTKLFNQNFKYPKNYKHQDKEEFSYTSVYFILYKNGNIDSLYVEASFANPTNKIYTSLFENELREFVTQTKWQPIISHGITLNTRMEFTIFHD